MTRRIILTADEAAQVRTTVEAGDGTVWIVRESKRQEWSSGAHEFVRHLPPAVFVAACQPCAGPMCRNGRVLYPEWEGRDQPCPDCRIELVGLCPECGGDGIDGSHEAATYYAYSGEISPCKSCWDTPGTVTVAHGYAVGQPLPICHLTQPRTPPNLVATPNGVTHNPADAPYHAPDLTDRLAHYGPPDSLVGQWALQVEVSRG